MTSSELSRPAWWAGRPVAHRVADAVPRCRIVVTGVLTGAFSQAGPGTGWSLVCHLDDGTGRLRLVFLGRRRIAGLASGSCVSVDGVVQVPWPPTVWNPAYRLEEPR